MSGFGKSFMVAARSSYQYERDVTQDFLNFFCELTGCALGFLHFLNRETGETEHCVFSEAVLERTRSAVLPGYSLTDQSFWTPSMLEGNPVVTGCSEGLHRAFGLPCEELKDLEFIRVPIRYDGEIAATVGLSGFGTAPEASLARELQAAMEADWRSVEVLLKQIWLGNQNRELTFNARTSEDLFFEVIGSVGNALEARDAYTAYHQSNVAFICAKIADRLNLSGISKIGLRLGAALHDIGKIALPAELLSKPTKLSEAEFQLLREHPVTGAGFFGQMDLPWPLADMIRQHHERLDGSGYPNGLKGNDICLEARIIGVADTFDAMSNDRPYRRARGPTAALDTLRMLRMKHFDPYIVDALADCYANDEELGNRYAHVG